MNFSNIFSYVLKSLCTITNSDSFKWGTNLNKIYEFFNSSMPVIFSGKTPYNPVIFADCSFVFSTFDIIFLIIIMNFFKIALSHSYI